MEFSNRMENHYFLGQLKNKKRPTAVYRGGKKEKMGFFSWITSDTQRSISNAYSNKETFPVYVLCPDGAVIEEKDYKGYGKFGGRDIYALVAQWNRPEGCKNTDGEWMDDCDCRKLGVEIACYDKNNVALTYPIKIVEDGTLQYEHVAPSLGCPKQGYFYDEL
ncbi:hypothetical protein LQZ18_16685 [Lachnospiraceae bacterium ZAX-1]